ncbi:hypothetical protein ES319_D03G045200v1 [Gossypium barbadense]|uniref:Uncharacterized protein n=2 Tax=Gossypium TaxID=3633 RepID=A0A5J5S150_GOSBA|nr:hypothetical protein ES319_D03G045200v1 [Gossypium barbadense]TYG75664.1 hypothetical protein ES288_D03G050400v1 [Gossypium darwinii]
MKGEEEKKKRGKDSTESLGAQRFKGTTGNWVVAPPWRNKMTIAKLGCQHAQLNDKSTFCYIRNKKWFLVIGLLFFLKVSD